jgi:hypothetical protein
VIRFGLALAAAGVASRGYFVGATSVQGNNLIFEFTNRSGHRMVFVSTPNQVSIVEDPKRTRTFTVHVNGGTEKSA